MNSDVEALESSGQATASPTRQAILDATVHFLLNAAFEQVSMEAIAKAAGVSRRTVFNQFSSKDALFREALKRVWVQLGMAEITEAEGALEDPRDTLRKVGLAIATFWLRPESVAIARMVIRESVSHPELTQHFLEAGKRPVTLALITYLKRLASLTRIDIADPDLAARQFIGLINGPIVFLRILGDTGQPSMEYGRRVVDEAVEMFFARFPLTQSVPGRERRAAKPRITG